MDDSKLLIKTYSHRIKVSIFWGGLADNWHLIGRKLGENGPNLVVNLLFADRFASVLSTDIIIQDTDSINVIVSTLKWQLALSL